MTAIGAEDVSMTEVKHLFSMFKVLYSTHSITFDVQKLRNFQKAYYGKVLVTFSEKSTLNCYKIKKIELQVQSRTSKVLSKTYFPFS